MLVKDFFNAKKQKQQKMSFFYCAFKTYVNDLVG